MRTVVITGGSDGLEMLGAVQGSTFARRINLAPLKGFGSKTGWLYSPSQSLMVLNECGAFTDTNGTVSIFAVYSTLPLDARIPTASTRRPGTPSRV